MLALRLEKVELVNRSKRSIRQNDYLHVLIRILAIETGVTEEYSKQVYFKQLANPNIFIAESVDKVTGDKITYLRSSSDLTTEEMSRAINTFRHWSEENGYYLPEADIDDEGNMVFASEEDEKAYNQGELEASRLENYIN